ncbi:hypothetical protein [Algisphaera agarilytica]|uniref:Uncharacterized protein n=1 Tax=Algisphaera agarilytica TaxID=1385975 RepID=A0A7X0H828_9BACT|nr:hypothetical protein [Algisphaera agarilytica]MBB6430777.1 hypothetical protein [Algisphaera agarilytica]
MDNRKVGLIIVLVLIGIGYAVMFNSRKLPPVEVMFIQPKATDRALFSFNDEVAFEEIKVVRPAVEPKEGELYMVTEDQIVWHLIPREPKEGEEEIERPATDLLRYGQGMRGMRRAEGIPRRGIPLEPGVGYIFSATLADGEGEVELTFTTAGKS